MDNLNICFASHALCPVIAKLGCYTFLAMKTFGCIASLTVILAAASLTGCRTIPPTPLIPENVSIVGGPASYIEGKKAFISYYNNEMLAAAPSWHPSHGNPPLSISAAQNAATRMLAKTIADPKEWKLKEITLRQPLGSFDEVPEGIWIYHFTFNGPKANGRVNSLITIVVLMNGKVVPLEPIESK